MMGNRFVLEPDIEGRFVTRACAARDTDTAVVYYSGHGIEVNGVNYLIPTDVILDSDIDVPYEAYSLDNLVQVLEPARRLRLVMLDASRENPFARSMKRTIASRAVGGGLAPIEPTSVNTLIGFAAKAGSIALDGDAANSPYAMPCSIISQRRDSTCASPSARCATKC